MAAGLSLQHTNLPRFQAAFMAHAEAMLDAELLRDVLLSDGELQAGEFSHATAIALRDGGPWGQGFPEPLFDGEFEVLSWRVVGERHLKLELGLLKLGLREPGLRAQRLNAIHFGGWEGVAPEARVRIAYRLEPDDYRGGDAVQLVVVHRDRC